MPDLSELERTLKRLPLEEKWQLAESLLQDLYEASVKNSNREIPPVPLRDFAQRRHKIFGSQVFPNVVLEAREGERW